MCNEAYIRRTKRLLRNYPAFCSRQYAGDFAATDILIDLERAIELAKLTDRQREALRYVYEEDLQQRRAGELMGVSQQSVAEYEATGVAKIAEVYEAWAWLDEKGRIK